MIVIKYITRIKLLLVTLIMMNQAMAQDINFSQFYELPMLRNPALAGIFNGDVRLSAAYRNQWQSVTVPYRTFGMGTEYKTSLGEKTDDFITLGLQATNDVAGDGRLTRSQVLPAMNYHKSIGGEDRGYISAGIMGGPVFQHFDPTRLSFDDQFVNGAYSAANPTNEVFKNTSNMYWDLSAGLSFSSIIGENTHYYLGMGLFHIMKPKVAFQQQYDVILNQKWIANAGLSIPVAEENKVIVYADYFLQGGSRLGQGGFMFSHDFSPLLDEKSAISAGMFYRWKDALIPVIKLDYYQMSVGITYDINTSKLVSASQYRGGFEVTLSYTTFRDVHNSSANKVKCPAFF